MEGPKRVQLMSAQTNKEKDKKNVQEPSFRFTLRLDETTDKTCTEFSYIELVKKLKLKKKSDDPYATQEEDDDEKLARALEEKYGEEFLDLGEGYDTEDSFIDNAEAYDEIVPSCLTTKLGGFYINSGLLDFRETENSLNKFSPVKKKKKKILVLDSDSDSENEFKKKSPKKAKLKNGDVKAKKRKRSQEDGEKTLKKMKNKDKDKKIIKQKTVAELLQGDSVDKKEPTKEDLANWESTIDNVIKDSILNVANDKKVSFQENLNESNSQDTLEIISKPPPDPETVVKLPENLPFSLKELIENMKKAALDPAVVKGKFFTSAINKTILEIDTQSRQGPPMQRSLVFSHLAAYLPCNKETILKRIKKLRQSEQDDKLKQPLQALKEAIDRAMPAQVEKHVQECVLFAQSKKETNQENKASEDKTDTDGALSQTESDDEETKTGLGDGEKDSSLQSKKKPRGPVKKFEWTEDVRNCLCKAVAMKLSSYELAKNKGQTAEDFLKAFLENDVRNLWPKGWMQTRILYRESRIAHARWTNPPQKLKKPVIISTKPAGFVSKTLAHVIVSAKSSTPSNLPPNAQSTSTTITIPSTSNVVNVLDRIVKKPGSDSVVKHTSDKLEGEAKTVAANASGNASASHILLEASEKSRLAGNSASKTTVANLKSGGTFASEFEKYGTNVSNSKSDHSYSHTVSTTTSKTMTIPYSIANILHEPQQNQKMAAAQFVVSTQAGQRSQPQAVVRTPHASVKSTGGSQVLTLISSGNKSLAKVVNVKAPSASQGMSLTSAGSKPNVVHTSWPTEQALSAEIKRQQQQSKISLSALGGQIEKATGGVLSTGLSRSELLLNYQTGNKQQGNAPVSIPQYRTTQSPQSAKSPKSQSQATRTHTEKSQSLIGGSSPNIQPDILGLDLGQIQELHKQVIQSVKMTPSQGQAWREAFISSNAVRPGRSPPNSAFSTPVSMAPSGYSPPQGFHAQSKTPTHGQLPTLSPPQQLVRSQDTVITSSFPGYVSQRSPRHGSPHSLQHQGRSPHDLSSHKSNQSPHSGH